MKTYLFIDTEIKAKLQKLANSKMLSLSTTANIIIKNMYYYVANETEYFTKDKKATCVKIKNECKFNLNAMINTNCITAYFNPNYIKAPLKLTNSTKRKIQSECDKTNDPNYLKNQMIRTYYKIQKGTI